MNLAIHVFAGISVLTATGTVPAGTSVLLLGIGDLQGGPIASEINALSGDGTTAVGWSRSAEGNEAIRWSAGQLESLGDFPDNGVNSIALAVSGDGSVVIGQGSSSYIWGSQKYNNNPAFIWRRSTGIQFAGTGIYRDGAGTCISEDGTVYGVSCSGGGWLSSNGFGNQWENNWGSMTCLSRDGSVCFGAMRQPLTQCPPGNCGGATFSANRIYRDKLTGHTTWGGFVSETAVRLCSSDGLSGVFRFADGVYLWSAASLTLLHRTGSFEPYAANSDLSELYGSAPIDGVNQAAVWTNRDGVVKLSDFISQKFGVEVQTSGRTLTACRGLSRNGLIIAGSGLDTNHNQEGWILRISYDWNNNGIDDAQEIRDGLIGDVNNDGIADCYQSGIECPGPNIAANPGFEAGNVLGDCTSELLAAGTSTGSWQVVSGVAERANRSNSCSSIGWAAEFGTYAIELRSTGGGPGTIRQAITTEPGRHYRVSFWMSANCSNGGAVSVRASAGNSTKTFTRTCDGTGRQSWLRCEFDFVAGLTTEMLEFASENQPYAGPVIDAISVSDVTVGCPSDLDGNGQVDSGDIGQLLVNFGPCR